MNKNLQRIKQRFEIIGNSKLLNRAIEIAIQISPTDMNVLITGESGSGKESFSKIIHSLSKNKHGKFIAINCGAIPEGTIDSELFGHEKGAFTDAQDTRKGYFEEVNNGTIFLDEIGEMPLSTQSRLLRVLEQGEFIRVGSSKIIKTNVRVIAATNADLKAAINKRQFREDLYYRLNTVPIYVPPLRERQDDINLLFRKFASEFAEKYNANPIKLEEKALSLLLKYRFPGNIRELKNLVNQISILEKDRLISEEVILNYLPKETHFKENSTSMPILYKNSNGFNPKFEKEILYKAILEMKQEIISLRKIILNLIQTNNLSISNLSTEELEKLNLNILEYKNQPINFINIKEDNNFIKNDEINITKNSNEENLSIGLKEKELVKKALLKHNHKRKLAAKELGISERTLYRKIKQYKLD
ncbi:MAG: sigma-54-dependent Fis family transcriptional regulator [Bacteroidetes bacterium]|nr:sigma-54-dependent Fis family transcriptional regulator [Bacteroidota bacterium]